MANTVKFTDFSPNSPIWWNPDGTGSSKYFGGNDLKTGSWSFTMSANQFILGAWDGSNVTSAIHAGLYFDNPDNPGSGTSVTSTWTANINGEIASLNGTGLVFHNYLTKTANTLTVGADGQVSGTFGGVMMFAATNITNSGTITGQYAIKLDGFWDQQTNGGLADDSNSDYSLNPTATTLANGNVIYPGWKPDSNITSATKVTITNKLGADITGVNAQNNPVDHEAVTAINSDSYASVVVSNDGTISGGHSHYLYVHSYEQDEAGWSGAAIYTVGALTLTNSATGVIDGDIESDWVGTSVNNNGEIDGTIIGFLSNTTTLEAPDPNDSSNTIRHYIDVLDPTRTILDANRNGIYDLSKGDILLSKTPNVYTNTGVINGTYNYGYSNHDTPDTPGDDHYFRVAFDLGAQVDQIKNSGTIHGNIWTGGGNDTLTNSKAIYGYVSMGDGNDTVTNSGTILQQENPQTSGPTVGTTAFTNEGGVGLGDGVNSLTNSGTIEDGVYAGAGKDTLTNNAGGFIYGGINLGSGGSVITNNAFINGGISTGDDPNNIVQREADADSVTNSATGVIYGGVDLGRGNNVVSNAGKSSATSTLSTATTRSPTTAPCLVTSTQAMAQMAAPAGITPSPITS